MPDEETPDIPMLTSDDREFRWCVKCLHLNGEQVGDHIIDVCPSFPLLCGLCGPRLKNDKLTRRVSVLMAHLDQIDPTGYNKRLAYCKKSAVYHAIKSTDGTDRVRDSTLEKETALFDKALANFEGMAERMALFEGVHDKRQTSQCSHRTIGNSDGA